MKRFSSRLFSLLLLIGLLVVGCKPDVKTPPTVVTPEVPVVKRAIPVPAFSSDSAYAHVAAQVAMGPRTANSEGHQKIRDYITSTLERYGAKVTVQEFPTKFYDGTRVKGYNIIGSFNPSAAKRIFLCAHYDTRPIADSPLAEKSRRNEPILGADDGGSGVGALLEIARLLGENPFSEMGVDLVFFDLEDNGKPDGTASREDVYSWGLGSQYWAGNPFVSGYNPKFGILLDMVGAEDAIFGREQYSKQYAGDVQNRIWNLAKKMGQGERFVDANIGFATDDHYFVNTIAGWPTVDIIYKPIGASGFGDHWHTHNDDLGIISTETLGAVGQVVTAVVYREAGNML